MLKIKMSDGPVVLGIDAENVRRLRAGQPIVVNLAELGGADMVCIMYGDTLADIKREIEQATGEPLPDLPVWAKPNEH